MGKTSRNILIAAIGTLAGMHIYNRFIATASVKRNKLPSNQGNYFDWNGEKIYYQKKGKGKPVLLVHDVDATASSMEWCKISHHLSSNHTVYTFDLLGCGRSDKPGIEYNNYLYVQILTAFVHTIIGEKTDIVASNLSSSFVLAANAFDEELFDHIVCINPTSINELNLMPDFQSKCKKVLLNMPIVGTFIYNILNNPLHIDCIFKEHYFSKPQLASTDLKDTYYEAAHLKESKGKYLLSSIFGNYMHINIQHILRQINKPICLIGSRELKNNYKNLEKYAKLNSNVDITMLSGAKNYPQLEIPEKTLRVITDFLKEDI